MDSDSELPRNPLLGTLPNVLRTGIRLPSTGVLKPVLIIVHFCCLLMGISCIVVGVFLWRLLSPANLSVAAVCIAAFVAIIAGSLAILFALFNWFILYNWKEKGMIQYLCTTVACTATFLLVLHVARIGNSHQEQDLLRAILFDKLSTYTHGNNDMGILQQQLKCCGVDSYKDWGNNNRIPPSCCSKQLSCNTADIGNIFIQGCFSSLYHQMELLFYILESLTCILTAFQCIGLLLSMILSCYHCRQRHYQQLP